MYAYVYPPVPVFTLLGDSHVSPANRRQGSSADLSVGSLSFSTLPYLKQDVFSFFLTYLSPSIVELTLTLPLPTRKLAELASNLVR